MASSATPSSAGTGHKKVLTYGGSSRKRPLSSKPAREPNSTLSISKPAHPIDRPRAPHGETKHVSKSNSLSTSTSTSPLRLASSIKPKALPHTSPLSNGLLGRKRDHASAFESSHAQRGMESQKMQKSTPLTTKHLDASPKVKEASSGVQTPTSRRPRLIDALAAQRASMLSDDDEDEEDEEASEPDQPTTIESKSVHGAHTLSSKDVRARALDRRGTTPTNRKVRFTYSQSRSALSESQTSDVFESPSRGINEGHSLDPLVAEPHAISPPPSDPFGMDESADDEDNDGDKARPAIKSVHELRRAGANNRFADEMDDLISRIGLPGAEPPTMRRNALCELAQKLQRQDFLRQFRDHASRDSVAREAGKERDVICGFALVSALLCFLHAGPAPNLVRQIAHDGVGRLLGMLLRQDEDVAALASQKRMSMSRNSRGAVGGVSNILRKLPIWHGYRLNVLSPRTAALQLLALLSRCADAALLDQIILDAQRDIITVATWASERGSHDDVDYALTVFTLETQSSAGVTPRLNSDGAHPARIAKLLSRALRQWPSGRSELDSAILKLAINTTNTEAEAAAFDDSDLFARLGRRITQLFTSVHHGAIGSGKVEAGKYDELLLVMGVMINIMEHCSPARRTVKEDTTTTLTDLWQENVKLAEEADSVEKSKVSVAVGYLSVLLGYMCLAGQAREHLEERVGRGGLASLKESITQFATMYKAVDSKAYALDALVDELGRTG